MESNPYLVRKARFAVVCRTLAFVLTWLLACGGVVNAQVLNDPVDVSQEFQKMEQVYFVGSRVRSFDPATGQGTLQWDRYLRSTTLSFNKIDVTLARRTKEKGMGVKYVAGSPMVCVRVKRWPALS